MLLLSHMKYNYIRYLTVVQMQATLREIGPKHMGEEIMKKFVQAYNEGKLVKPEDAGHVAAALSLSAPKSLSGKFISWDSDECREFRR